MRDDAWNKLGNNKLTAFVVGDLIYDYWTEINASRIAPDAPAPVWETVGKSEYAPGGAGNAARQFLHLNADCTLATVHDDRHFLDDDCGGIRVLSRSGTVACKRRIVSHGHVLARLDQAELIFKHETPESRHHKTGEVISELAEAIVKRDRSVPAVALLCDYAQGFWSTETAAHVVRILKSSGVLVVVDPKPKGVPLEAWSGADVIKVNSSEAVAFVRNMPGANESFAAKRIASALGSSVVVTRGARAPLVFSVRSKNIEPTAYGRSFAESTRPVWASGAGDCFAAYLAASLAHGNTLAESAEIAHAAGIAYTRKTYNLPVNPHEAMEAVNAPGARVYHSIPELRKRLLQIDERTQRIGYTSGVFDLFHPGHAEALRYAKQHCDFLMVAVNTSESAERIKFKRPVMTTAERLSVVGSCRDVDAVIAFDEDTPETLYAALGTAHVIVKGSDWKGKTVAGAKYAGEVVFAPEVYPIHSTDIRKRLT